MGPTARRCDEWMEKLVGAVNMPSGIYVQEHFESTQSSGGVAPGGNVIRYDDGD